MSQMFNKELPNMNMPILPQFRNPEQKMLAQFAVKQGGAA